MLIDLQIRIVGHVIESKKRKQSCVWMRKVALAVAAFEICAQMQRVCFVNISEKHPGERWDILVNDHVEKDNMSENYYSKRSSHSH